MRRLEHRVLVTVFHGRVIKHVRVCDPNCYDTTTHRPSQNGIDGATISKNLTALTAALINGRNRWAQGTSQPLPPYFLPTTLAMRGGARDLDTIFDIGKKRFPPHITHAYCLHTAAACWAGARCGASARRCTIFESCSKQ